MSIGYEKITVDADGIYLDGQKIDGTRIPPEIRVKRAGPHDFGDTITLTISTEQVDITDAAKQLPNAHIIEEWGH